MQSVVETGIYLADAKNQKTDLTKAERNEFKATLAALAAAYRGKK
jgi:hypothetical protein